MSARFLPELVSLDAFNSCSSNPHTAGFRDLMLRLVGTHPSLLRDEHLSPFVQYIIWTTLHNGPLNDYHIGWPEKDKVYLIELLNDAQQHDW